METVAAMDFDAVETHDCSQMDLSKEKSSGQVEISNMSWAVFYK